RDRETDEDQADAECGRQPWPRHDPERGYAAEQAADPDRGREEADTALSESERLEREHDDEDVDGAGDERLHSIQRDDEPKPGVARDRSKAGERLPQEALLRRTWRRSPVDLDADEHERGDEEGDAGDREDDLRRREGDQQSADRGAGEDPDALD